MRISSPAFTSILTGFSLRTRAVPRAGRPDRHGRNPGLAGFGRTDRAAPTDNVERTKAPATAVTTCAKRSVVNMVGLRNLALPPAHPTVMPILSMAPCQPRKMAEIRKISSELSGQYTSYILPTVGNCAK